MPDSTRTILQLVIVRTNPHEPVFSPILPPAIFNDPVLGTLTIREVLSVSYNSSRVIEAFPTAAALSFKISNDPTSIVFDAIVDIECYTNRTMTN
jgi:hypothetical protein